VLTLDVHDRTKVISALPDVETAALIACFGSVAESSDELEHLAGRTLARLRDQRQWLACRCMPGSTDGPPLMAPRQREGVLHIFRLAGKPHAGGCPFYRDLNDSSADTGVASSGGGHSILQPAGDSWLILDRNRDAGDAGEGEESAGPASKPRSRPPSLAVVLFTALEAIGLTRVRPDEIRSVRGQPPMASPVANHYKRLRQLESRAIAPGVPWSIAGCTYLPALGRFMAHTLPAHFGDFNGHRPQGLFLGMIQSIEREGTSAVLHWQGKVADVLTDARIPVYGSLKRFGAVRDAAGPFWCAAAIGQRLGESEFRVLQAYVHPVHSKSLLFPVDSNLERLTARILLDQLSYWSKPNTLNALVTLIKPVFDLQSADGTWCRPDFILEFDNGRQIVVETMGRDDPVYLADKERMQAFMRGIPGTVDLVTYRPGIDDEAEFRRTLTTLVRTHA